MSLDYDTRWLQLVRSRFRGRLRKDEYTIEICPYCGNPKKNFEINVHKLIFSCWACRTSGTLRDFFHDFGLPLEGVPETPRRHIQVLDEQLEDVQLPPEAVDVLDRTQLGSGWAVSYLAKRGLSRSEIASHGLKFCMVGKYAGRIIWPLYDGQELVFFVARRFMHGPGKPYDYPEIRRRNLCHVVLGTERRMTLVLVEGVFQIPSIQRLGYSVMPMLGLSVTPEQARQLARRRFDRYVVFPDHDAIQAGMRIGRTLAAEGLHALVARTPGPDSDELAADVLENVIESATRPTVASMIRNRLERLMTL